MAAVLAIVLGTLVLRTLTLVAAQADGTVGLHVDEAQYWVWSRDLAWGYASKPPLIAALIALATHVGGDSVLAIRSVGLLIYPLTAAVLAALAWQLARADVDPATGHRLDPAVNRRAARAAVWATLLFAASPLAGLLGLVTTTDAPLLLAWSGACALLWLALHARRRAVALPLWVALGAVAGLGLLAKYSFAAWLVGAAWAIVWARRDPTRPAAARRADLAGLGLAAATLLLVVSPHLGWNAAEGWPAVRHTLQITTQDAETDLGATATAAMSAPAPSAPVHRGLMALGRVLGVPLSLALLVGPLWLAWLPTLGSRLRARGDRRALRFVLALHLPLLAVGLLQAGVSAPQMNWLAPVVPGLVLVLALALADTGRAPLDDGDAVPPRRVTPVALAGLTLAVHAAIALTLPLAAPLTSPLSRALDGSTPAVQTPAPPVTLPRRLDIWARMRGWEASFADLRAPALAQLARHPGIEVVTASRSVIAQGRHAWRDLPITWRSWKPPGPPQHHFQRVAPWPPADGDERPDRRSMPVLLVLDHPAPPALRQRVDGLVCLARSAGTPRLSLWLAWPKPADAGPETPAPDQRRPPPDDDCPPAVAP